MKRLVFISILLVYVILIGSVREVVAQKKVERTYYSAHRIRSITYISKNKVSKEIIFYPNGKKMSESNYDSTGNLFGTQIEYFENGKKRKENFILSIESVPYKYFSDTTNDDIFIDVLTYKAKCYFETGSIKSKGFIVNGMRGGYWVFYNTDGTINKTEFYKTLIKDD